MKIAKMRFPTDAEYDKLCDIAKEYGHDVFWTLFSFTKENGRGFYSPKYTLDKESRRSLHFDAGFRPAFEVLGIENLPEDVIDGKVPVTIGTLYLGALPVLVQKYDTDTVSYDNPFNSPITIREALEDLDYQVGAYHVGDGVFVADRVLLLCDECNDILEALDPQKTIPEKPVEYVGLEWEALQCAYDCLTALANKEAETLVLDGIECSRKDVETLLAYAKAIVRYDTYKEDFESPCGAARDVLLKRAILY